MDGCLHWVISKVLKEVKEKQLNQQNISEKTNGDGRKLHSLTLPYYGLKRKHVINSMRKQLNTKLIEKN